MLRISTSTALLAMMMASVAVSSTMATNGSTTSKPTSHTNKGANPSSSAQGMIASTVDWATTKSE